MTTTRLLLLACTLLAACAKNNPAPTRSDLLTGKNWRMDSMTMPVPLATGFTLMVVSFANLPACRLDNTYHFERGGAYVFDDGAASCSGPSQTGSGIWQWTSGETQVITSLNGVATTWDVAELTADRVKLVETVLGPGMTERIWRVYVVR